MFMLLQTKFNQSKMFELCTQNYKIIMTYVSSFLFAIETLEKK